MHTRSNSGTTLSQKSIKIKQDDIMFFSKRLTSKASMTKFSSTEDNYHGGSSVAIPFIWESQPGTPKVKHFKENPLPPLTPPPSYFYTNPKRTAKKYSKPNLLDNFLTKHGTRRESSPSSPRYSSSNSQSPSSSSSSSSSRSRLLSPQPSSHSIPSSPIIASNNRRRRQLFDSRMKEKRENNECEDSTLCFGNIGRGPRGGRAMPRGCYASIIKVLFE